MSDKPNWRLRASIIAADIEDKLKARYPDLAPLRAPDGKGLSHALFMAQAIQHDDAIDSDTKACRWLGWLQAMLAYEGFSDLETAKQANVASGVQA